MSWIKTISYEQADGALRKLYERVKGPDNNIDNIMLAHSLRPHTMTGHMTLYKNVLHHPRNTVEKSFLEMIGVYTSMLNKCHYCIEHHFTGMKLLLNDDAHANRIRQALESGNWKGLFDEKTTAALAYVKKLTQEPSMLGKDDVDSLRSSGWEDGEILEINQVTGYFCYANRTVLGLGVNSEGDILGLSPKDETEERNWQHK